MKNSYTLSENSATLDMKSNEPVKHHANLTLITGTVFIIGEVAGGTVFKPIKANYSQTIFYSKAEFYHFLTQWPALVIDLS